MSKKIKYESTTSDSAVGLSELLSPVETGIHDIGAELKTTSLEIRLKGGWILSYTFEWFDITMGKYQGLWTGNF
jgi:hypothetical protein